jgi:anti-sigma factor RsiW
MVRSLLERYVDGDLDPPAAREVDAHAAACARCSARIAAARGIAHALSAEPPVAAPGGFFEKVMDGVYLQALQVTEAREGVRAGQAAAGSRFYRRLGLSMVLTAAVLGVSLFVPRASYMTLVGAGGTSAVTRGSGSVVKIALHGAGSAVQVILGESPRGGDGR